MEKEGKRRPTIRKTERKRGAMVLKNYFFSRKELRSSLLDKRIRGIAPKTRAFNIASATSEVVKRDVSQKSGRPIPKTNRTRTIPEKMTAIQYAHLFLVA